MKETRSSADADKPARRT